MRISQFNSALLLSALLLSACGNKNNQSEDATQRITVVAQMVEKTNVAREISLSGNIEGNKTVKLGFMVAGKVNFVAAEEGAPIQSGQLVASLDAENYLIAKDIADANLAQAQDEYDRLTIMHNRKSISESDYSKITNTLKMAKAQQRLQAKNVSDTKLYSPIKGVLLKKGAEAGEIIGTGLPLFVISDIQTIKVNAAIPESDLRLVKAGDVAQVYISSVDSTFTGKVIEIGSLAEATTRTFTIKVMLENKDYIIRPGMTAEVKIATTANSETIVIPGEAILHDIDNSAYVYVVDEAKNQAFKRPVSIGRMIGNNVEITSGLAADERIVTGGQNHLNNGSSITIK